MDEHKKVARQVETQLNAQLALFAKACQGTSRLRDPSKDVAAAASVADQSASELEPQIQALLNQYNAAIDAMSRALPASNPAGSPSSTGADHTIQRCRQIAAEYLQDFRKSKATLQTNRQRADLLGDSRSSALRPRTETLLKEQSSIETSLRLADEMLESAQSSRLSLAHQRDLFANVSNRMATMAEKLPLIGSLVGRITGAKRKDALVMACVISTCIILMFLYVVYVKFG